MSSSASRTIRLRRPATVSLLDEPFVPDGAPDLLEEVEARWDALCARNPAYFDGRLCHVFGVHRNGYGGAVIHAADCAFRFHAVQDERFDLGVRPLGVKGLTIRDEGVLLGRRAANVAAYGGQWEFAPGGVVEPGEDPAATVSRELEEETGLSIRGEPTPIAILYDPVVRSWEMVFRMQPSSEGTPTTAEYDELRWCRRDELPSDLTPTARQMIALL
jgi:8-oxo-dGTP pyrophosphatase MutT (NUDIX family)